MLIWFFQKFIDIVLYSILMLHNWYYTLNQHNNVLIIRSLYINKTPFFIGFSFIISGALKGFWRQHAYDENTRWAARVQETETHWIGTKTIKKGFIKDLHCNLNINKKYNEKITAYFICFTFVSTFNILIDATFRTRPGDQIEGSVNFWPVKVGVN